MSEAQEHTDTPPKYYALVHYGLIILVAYVAASFIRNENLLLLFTIIGAGFYLAILTNSPGNALLLWLVCAPIGEFYIRIPPLQSLITFDRLGVGAVFAYVIVQMFVKKDTSLFPLDRIEKLMLLLIGIVLLSGLLLSDIGIGVLRSSCDAFMLPAMAYFIGRRFFQDDRSFNKATTAVMIMGMYLSLIGLYEWATHSDVMQFKEGLKIWDIAVKSDGPFRQHTTFGMVQGLVFFVILHKFMQSQATSLRSRMISRILYPGALIMIILNMYSNLSRGRWVGFVGGVMVWAITYRTNRSGKLLKASLGIFLVLGIVLSAGLIRQTGVYRDRIANVSNVYGRLAVWSGIAEYIVKHPITGIGYRNLRPTLEKDHGLYRLGGYKGLDTSHNSYLEICAELGIFGFLTLMLILATVAVTFLRYRRVAHDTLIDKSWHASALAILPAYLIPAAFANTFSSLELPNKLFYFLVGITVARYTTIRKAKAREHELDPAALPEPSSTEPHHTS